MAKIRLYYVWDGGKKLIEAEIRNTIESGMEVRFYTIWFPAHSTLSPAQFERAVKALKG